MFAFLIVLIALIGLVMIAVVLLQSGKGGGLAGIAAGGATRQILGARQAPDILEKATWTLATVFIVLCVLTNFTIDRGDRQESIIQQRERGATPEQVAPMPQDAPAAPVFPAEPDGVDN
jgi:preprotein translocase subunit SecG